MPHSLLASAEAALPALLGAVAFIVLAVVALIALILVANWRIYQKAGRPGWASIIPFYNTVVMLEFTNRPLWWVILCFVPLVNIVVGILIARRLAGVFGKGVWFTVGILLLPFIFIPILGFGRSTYTNTYPPAGPMSEAVKWTLLALLAWLLTQTAFSVKLDSLIDALEANLAADSYESGWDYDDASEHEGNTGYTVDDLYVYFDDMTIPGADPLTFYDLGKGYGADENSVYYEGWPINADPATFEVLGDDGMGYDAKDAYDWYHVGSIVSGPESGEL